MIHADPTIGNIGESAGQRLAARRACIALMVRSIPGSRATNGDTMNLERENTAPVPHSSSEFGGASVTDIGLDRSINEDRFTVIETSSGTAWFVLDGMGGVAGGEFAAQLAVDAIRRYVEGHECAAPAEILRGAISEGNRAVVIRRQNQKFSSMGTTVVALMIDEMEVAVSHVGDSRSYLVHDSGITQLTVDDTLVQQMVDAGTLGPEEALSHPDAHLLTRCLGTDVGLDIPVQHFWRTPNEASDTIVLCSDGLYGLVSDVEIADVVRGQTPAQACRELIALANDRGGYDNITVSIVPLLGSLTDEPPTNWDRIGAERARQRAKLNRPPLSFVTHALILVSLAMVSAVVTVVVFGIQQSFVS